MPFLNLQERLGIDADKWMLMQSGAQPYKQASRCHVFEKEWIECSDGIGRTRAKAECRPEYEDFYECMHMQKLGQRLLDIRKQKEKLVKEGKYTPPERGSGQQQQQQQQ